MKITKQIKEPYHILFIEGKVNLESNAVFKSALDNEIGHGHFFIALDLAKTSDMDNQTIGLLVQYWKSIKALQGELAIVNPSRKVTQLLEATKLSALIRVLNCIEQPEKGALCALRA